MKALFSALLVISSASTAGANPTPWWTTMDDPQLETAVNEAMDANLDLVRLRAIERQLSAISLQSASPLLPSINGNGQAQLAPVESLGFGFIPPGASDPNAPKSYSNGTATLDVRWQVDLFGGNTANLKAALADAEAAGEDRAALAAQIAALVGNAYFDVVTAERRVEVLRTQLTLNEELLEVLELRYERGDARALDVLQQRQSVAAARAQIPTAALAADLAEQRLSVLLGQDPNRPIPTAEGLPTIEAAVSSFDTEAIVSARPELRAESERLQSAKLRRWSSKTSMLPVLSLGARVGWQFIDITEFNDQDFWNTNASVSVPIFNGGRAIGAVRASRAAFDAQQANLDKAILTAKQEVASASAQEMRLIEALAAQEDQYAAAAEAAKTARAQYLEGIAPFIDVQLTISREQQAALSLLQARRDVLGARIALATALGGTWTKDLASN